MLSNRFLQGFERYLSYSILCIFDSEFTCQIPEILEVFNLSTCSSGYRLHGMFSHCMRGKWVVCYILL